jgi:hypothetical protein
MCGFPRGVQQGGTPKGDPRMWVLQRRSHKGVPTRGVPKGATFNGRLPIWDPEGGYSKGGHMRVDTEVGHPWVVSRGCSSECGPPTVVT